MGYLSPEVYLGYSTGFAIDDHYRFYFRERGVVNVCSADGLVHCGFSVESILHDITT